MCVTKCEQGVSLKLNIDLSETCLNKGGGLLSSCILVMPSLPAEVTIENTVAQCILSEFGEI